MKNLLSKGEQTLDKINLYCTLVLGTLLLFETEIVTLSLGFMLFAVGLLLSHIYLLLRTEDKIYKFRILLLSVVIILMFFKQFSF